MAIFTANSTLGNKLWDVAPEMVQRSLKYSLEKLGVACLNVDLGCLL